MEPTPGQASPARHPAEVTSDRLAAAVERWHEKFTPPERDMVAAIRRRLQDIADAESARLTKADVANTTRLVRAGQGVFDVIHIDTGQFVGRVVLIRGKWHVQVAEYGERGEPRGFRPVGGDGFHVRWQAVAETWARRDTPNTDRRAHGAPGTQ
jgi:hypothetical protein